MNVYLYQNNTEKVLKNIYIGEYGWKPGSNTIAYLPLKGNLNDLAGNYTRTSGANVSYDTTVANITVAHLSCDNNSGYIYTTTNGPTLTGSKSYTMSGWVKLPTATSGMTLLNTGVEFGAPASYNGMAYYKFYENQYKGYVIMYFGGSGSPNVTYQYNNNCGTDWHLWTITYTPGSLKIYLDATQVSSTNATLTGTANPTTPMWIGKPANPSWVTDAYYSDIIFEDKEWTADEITEYYNQTKSNYGL